MQALGCSDVAALEFLKHRVGMNDTTTQFYQELLEVDDVHDVLDRHDVKEMDKHKEIAQRGLESSARFVHDFGARVAKTKPAPLKISKKFKGTAALPSRLPIVTTISQAEASKFCPPAGSLWLANFGGSWQAHHPPLARICRSFSKYGEHEAMRLCFVYLWEKHCVLNGLEFNKCPMAGVLDSEPVPGDAVA